MKTEIEYVAYHRVKRVFIPIMDIESENPEDIEVYDCKIALTNNLFANVRLLALHVKVESASFSLYIKSITNILRKIMRGDSRKIHTFTFKMNIVRTFWQRL